EESPEAPSDCSKLGQHRSKVVLAGRYETEVEIVACASNGRRHATGRQARKSAVHEMKPNLDYGKAPGIAVRVHVQISDMVQRPLEHSQRCRVVFQTLAHLRHEI